MLLLAVQTGLRVSELIGLNCGDVTLGVGAHVRCEGKGRKQRAVPLTAARPQAVLRVWLDRTRRPSRRAAVPHPHRTAAQPRRRRNAASATTPPPPPTAARPSPANSCTPTSCGTAAR